MGEYAVLVGQAHVTLISSASIPVMPSTHSVQNFSSPFTVHVPLQYSLHPSEYAHTFLTSSVPSAHVHSRKYVSTAELTTFFCVEHATHFDLSAATVHVPSHNG